jgi:hypothetical protein
VNTAREVVVVGAVLVDFVTLNVAGVGVEVEVNVGTGVGDTPMNEVVACVGVGKFMVYVRELNRALASTESVALMEMVVVVVNFVEATTVDKA